jgi:uncharacterized protein (DUF433 family)
MSTPLDRISIDPNVCFGKPCIKGTRIWVSLILDYLASGDSEADILANYPHLRPEDIRAAIAYGAEVARERIIPIPATAALLQFSSRPA